MYDKDEIIKVIEHETCLLHSHDSGFSDLYDFMYHGRQICVLSDNQFFYKNDKDFRSYDIRKRIEQITEKSLRDAIVIIKHDIERINEILLIERKNKAEKEIKRFKESIK